LEGTADKAQSLIFELMVICVHAGASTNQQLILSFHKGEKIRELISSAYFVDWTPSELAPSPHSYVEDLISYLQVCDFSGPYAADDRMVTFLVGHTDEPHAFAASNTTLCVLHFMHANLRSAEGDINFSIDQEV
jgi:hypothetical protein